MHMKDNRIFRLSCGALVLFLALAVVTVPTHAQTESLLYSFCPPKGCTDGKYPDFVALVMDAKGNLYGTTQNGGAHFDGTVFRVTPSGQEEFYSFKNNGMDGVGPAYGLVFDKQGNLYGTTWGGGLFGYGTVFKISPAGVETVLHSFNEGAGDGANPEGAMVIDATGNLYGATQNGGTNCLPAGCGSVFQITPTGEVTILYSFSNNGTDGIYPGAGLALDTNGNLYGTTGAGGTNNKGTVFELSPSNVETILHSFDQNGADGHNPGYAPLVLDREGNIYGTTAVGGAQDLGTAFKVTPSGVETILHSFGANNQDGQFPYGGLVLDPAGNLFGTTDLGGPNEEGTVFKLTPSGAETIIYSFAGYLNDGQNPSGSLLIAKGSIYGVAQAGGATGYGTVFKIAP